MRLPRVSVGILMAVVGWVAIQLAGARFLDDGRSNTGQYALPMVTVCGLCALFVVRGLSRNGETSPFLTGVLIFGACSYCVGTQLEPLVRSWEYNVARHFFRLISPFCLNDLMCATGDALFYWIVDLPFFLLALAGGWLAKRIGVKLVIERKPG
jgi:hypothetical protein